MILLTSASATTGKNKESHRQLVLEVTRFLLKGNTFTWRDIESRRGQDLGRELRLPLQLPPQPTHMA